MGRCLWIRINILMNTIFLYKMTDILREQLPEDKDDYYKLCAETSLLAKRMSQTAFRAFLKNSGSRDAKKMRYIFRLY